MAYTPSGGSGDLGFGMTFTLVDNFSAVADKIQNRFNSFATAATKMNSSTIADQRENLLKMKQAGQATNLAQVGQIKTDLQNQKTGQALSLLNERLTGQSTNAEKVFQARQAAQAAKTVDNLQIVQAKQAAKTLSNDQLTQARYATQMLRGEQMTQLFEKRQAAQTMREETRAAARLATIEENNRINYFSNNMSELKSGIFEVAEAFAIMLPVKLGLEQASKFELIDIRLKTLLGSASEAKRVFDNLKADEPYMPFNIETLLKGNTALIAAKVSADDARSAVKAVANAVAANAGGNAEMDRALATLKKTKELGFANKQRINQFSTGAQIPIYELLHESTGRSIPDLIKKGAIITYDEIVNAFKVAMGKGGLYENALGNMAQSISGKLTTLKTQVMFFWNEIGQSSMGTFHAIINLAINLLTILNKFLATPMGRFIGGIAQGLLVLTSLSLAFHGAGRAFGALVRMAGGEGQTIFTMIKSFSAATWKWGLGLVVLAVIFETINKAMNAWAMASDKVGTSFTKFEKFGGLLTAFFTIFTGMDENFKFNMPEEMYNKLKNAGLLETVQGVALFFAAVTAALSWIGAGSLISGASIIAFLGWIVQSSITVAALVADAVTIGISWLIAGGEIAAAGIMAFIAWL